MVPLGETLIGAGVPLVGTANGLYAGFKILGALPYVSELLHFTGSETPQIKDFNKALEHLEILNLDS